MLLDLFWSRSSLEAEIIALRPQLNVLRRSAGKRPALSIFGRFVFVLLYRLALALLHVSKVRPDMFDEYRDEAAPIIVSALFGGEDFAWLDELRRSHFPRERNLLSAHLTLFHHLPPSSQLEIDMRLREATRTERPPAEAAALINLGRGVAVRIEAPRLSAIRAELAFAFAGLLTRQDAAGWRPHVTN